MNQSEFIKYCAKLHRIPKAQAKREITRVKEALIEALIACESVYLSNLGVFYVYIAEERIGHDFQGKPSIWPETRSPRFSPSDNLKKLIKGLPTTRKWKPPKNKDEYEDDDEIGNREDGDDIEERDDDAERVDAEERKSRGGRKWPGRKR